MQRVHLVQQSAINLAFFFYDTRTVDIALHEPFYLSIYTNIDQIWKKISCFWFDVLQRSELLMRMTTNETVFVCGEQRMKSHANPITSISPIENN